MLILMGRVGFEPTASSDQVNIPYIRLHEFLRNLPRFEDYLVLEAGLVKSTAIGYIRSIRFVYNQIPVFNSDELRIFLKCIKEDKSPSRYSNILKALRHYTRFIGRPELASRYAFPHPPLKPKIIPTKNDLARFYDAIPTLRMKAFFITTASSGLRRGELLNLTIDDVDRENRTLVPRSHKGYSKKSWISFFNIEAEQALNLHLENRNKRGPKSDRVFPFGSNGFKREWKTTKIKSKIPLKVKDLRDWFCSEMGRLGVPDRYVDAFCGRMPKSILSRHYTDYSPEKLKEIYDKADLKILS